VTSIGHHRALYVVFFMAGAPALLYQTVWQRVLTLYFGVDIYSTSITVASVMLGLGIGSWLGGRLADRTPRPLVWYAWAEFFIGCFGAISLPLFGWVGSSLAGSPLAIVIPVDFLLLLVPTVLMGTTLPLMCRIVTAKDADIGRHLSRLYGLNTLGAACGALVSVYLLIGLYGLDRTTFIAAGLNLLLAAATGCLVLWSPQGAATGPKPVTTQLSEASSVPAMGFASVSNPVEAKLARPISLRFVLLLSFLSGFVALGYEIVWYRLLACILHGTVYVFGTILCFYLLGIGLGSLWARTRIDRPGPLRRFGLCQVGIAAYSLALFGLLEHASWLPGVRHLIAASTFTSFHPSPELISGKFTLASIYSMLDVFLWVGVVLGVPTVLMGYGFPNLVRAASRSVDNLGRSVGGIYFINILGSTLGSLVVGFVLLDRFGSEITLAVLIVCGGVTGWLTFLRAAAEGICVSESTNRSANGRWLLATIALVGLAAALVPWRGALVKALHLAAYADVDYVGAEDRSGIVVLRKQDRIIAFDQERQVLGKYRLYIDGSPHGGFDNLDAPEGDWAVDCALSAHPNPRRVLSIGMGDGRMCVAAALNPAVDELLVVELNGSLGRVLEQTAQGEVLFGSPKVKHVVDDGRRWLLAHPEAKFDLIMMWPLHAAHAHSGSLYSREFFEIVGRHLTEGGLLFVRSADLYSTARTIAVSFPYVVRAERGTYLASFSPLRFDLPRSGLRRDEFLSKIEADRELILEETNGAAINFDLRPRSEYYVVYPYARSLQTWGQSQEDPHYRFSDRSRAAALIAEPTTSSGALSTQQPILPD